MYKQIFFALTLLAVSASCVPSQRVNWPIFVDITKWIGDLGVSEEENVQLWAPETTVFHDVMKNAAKQDPKFFNIEEVQSENGTLITSIGGLANDDATGHYWMLYVLKEKPNHLSPPKDDQLSPVGK